MTHCPWGLNPSGKVTGGSAFCSWFVVALFTHPLDTTGKGLSLLECNNNTKASYCSSQQLVNERDSNRLHQPGTA